MIAKTAKIVKQPKSCLYVKNKSKYLDFLSLLFITVGILAVLNTLFIAKNPSQLLWLCYIGLLIIGIGVYRRSGWLIASQLNILFLPVIIWNIDFFYQLTFGSSLFGIAQYFFNSNLSLGKVISLQHIITVPLAIFCLYKMGLKRKDAWKISIFQITVFYFLTFLLTNSSQNVNCVFGGCARIPPFSGYPLIWFALFILLIIITNTIINLIFYKKLNQPSQS